MLKRKIPVWPDSHKPGVKNIRAIAGGIGNETKALGAGVIESKAMNKNPGMDLECGIL